ncbi:MAG: glycosyltransferase family 2 protein [Myxococcales bacterium]|nr:glycosyltransferase family 2 protein [Myxococcales bacterium]
MAGRGSRFRDAGYADAKPLIPVLGTPMIKLVVDNLRPARPHRFVFLCLGEHVDRYALGPRLREIAPGCEIVRVDAVTAGAACTVLLARALIDGDRALMIANCDQWIDADVDQYLSFMDAGGYAGAIMTMRADDPKWSFVRFGPDGAPCEVVEKKVVSHEATVGIYNFRRGADFVAAADEMIARGLRVNGEFYVAPVYNQLLARGARIGVYNIGGVDAGMYGLGTPADLERFCRLDVAKRAIAERTTIRPA